MVDFSKRIGEVTSEKPIDPNAIYDTLDRESDKGPLRPPQISILSEWFNTFRNNNDVILKLHTGQGKTIIGLLILQSKLNEGKGPALYLCANNYLVDQTCQQAKQFGVNVVRADPEIPHEFINSQQILVTTIHKLFNGLTKFGLGSRSSPVNSIILDDAHACIDIIKDSFSIRLSASSEAYREIFGLFEIELEHQGAGTFADIKRGKYDALLPVPYWDWFEKSKYVAEILSKYSDCNEIKFTWPLLKDMVADCICVISGNNLEIAPHLPPIDCFGSFTNSEHKVYMSATVADDSFLIKVLGLNSNVVNNPLLYKDEKWSGEKMILIPSLIHTSLDRSYIVEHFAKPSDNRKFGVVALCPSFNSCRDWESYGAIKASSDDIDTYITNLKEGTHNNTLILVNRYDGIDLPDSACRILIFDSRPYTESLIEKYIEECLANSESIAIRVARKIEQGLGRSVRGEKDYSSILIIGAELIKYLQTSSFKKYFSEQTRTQIDIGFKIAEFAKDEVEIDNNPWQVLRNLINQSLRRDDGWKQFYIEKMNKIKVTHMKPSERMEIFLKERQAETKSQAGQYSDAVEIIQDLINQNIENDIEKGWYLQEMARYSYRMSKTKSNNYQINAHRINRYLLKPLQGITIEKLKLLSQKRIQNIIEWINLFENYQDLSIELEDILSNLRFGINSDSFENALNRLGKAIGFAAERPEKEWKEGPDNLWNIKDNEYILFECKNEVRETRSEISESEVEQMNRSATWFNKNYKGCSVKRIMIIPTRKLSPSASFLYETEIMRKRELNKLIDNVRSFFKEYISLDFKDLSSEKVKEYLQIHKIRSEDFLKSYSINVSNGL